MDEYIEGCYDWLVETWLFKVEHRQTELQKSPTSPEALTEYTLQDVSVNGHNEHNNVYWRASTSRRFKTLLMHDYVKDPVVKEAT